MELLTVGSVEALAAHVVKEGSDEFTVVAGKSLVIETSPKGVEILNVECPAGKTWIIDVLVTVMEMNA